VAWANLDDQFPKHPKIVGLTDGAFRLQVSGICHAAQYLTDGLIQPETVPILMPRYRSRVLDELVDKGLWIPDGAAYTIHDYLEWNRSKAQVLAERERRSKAGRKGADNRWHKP
jgi:hypothetical protein